MKKLRVLFMDLLLVIYFVFPCEGTWCVQIDVEAVYDDIQDSKAITQSELRDVMIPIVNALETVLQFTCDQVDVDLGPLRYEKSKSTVKVAGSMFFTPRFPGQEDDALYKECVKTSNLLKPFNGDPSYFGKLRNKYPASAFEKSNFRDFCGPPIPIITEDKFTNIEHAVVAILVFLFIFIEMLVTGFLYLKYKKTPGNDQVVSTPASTSGTSTSQVSASNQVPTMTIKSGKFPSLFSRKKPKRYEFREEDIHDSVVPNPYSEVNYQTSFTPQRPKEPQPAIPKGSSPAIHRLPPAIPKGPSPAVHNPPPAILKASSPAAHKPLPKGPLPAIHKPLPAIPKGTSPETTKPPPKPTGRIKIPSFGTSKAKETPVDKEVKQ